MKRYGNLASEAIFGKINKVIFVIGFILALFLAARSAFASNLYLFPQSANIPYGEVLTVNIGLNTYGESVNGVSAYLSYPTDKVEVAWISYGSSFPIQAEESVDNGLIRISRGSIEGENGNVSIATIGLKGKSYGSASLSFVDGSYAPRASDSSDSLNLMQSAGGIFMLGMPNLGLSPLVFL